MDSRKEHPGQDPVKAPGQEMPGHGPQGIDKAPGEEPSQDNVQFTQEAFKGKKVDRDPTNEQEEPMENQDL
ncbi:MAG TPA: hypothetical protein VD794_03555 [Flavisolibacter sp.]|nr:hypothetical protein [Flavisolibacter sp.]